MDGIKISDEGVLTLDLAAQFHGLPFDTQMEIVESWACSEHVIESVVAQLVEGYTPRNSYSCFSTGTPFYEKWRKLLLDKAGDAVAEMVREILAERERQEKALREYRSWAASAWRVWNNCERNEHGYPVARMPKQPEYTPREHWTIKDARAWIEAHLANGGE